MDGFRPVQFRTWVGVVVMMYAGRCVLASEGRQACPQSAMGSPCATHVLVANGIDTHIHFLFTDRPGAINLLFKNHSKSLFGLSPD